MSLYQRRLASSTRAMRRSLENRARRLEEGLKRAQELARQAPPDLPDPEELEEMEESERERLEAHAGGGHARRQRRAGARTRSPNCDALAVQAQAVEDSGRRGEALAAQGRCCRRRASSTTRTSGCSSSPSSRTRSTTSWID